MRPRLGFIVEGHCEYDSIPSIVSKIEGHFNYPMVNAQSIGNIIKHTDKLLLDIVKTYSPEKIIISLDYRDALRQGIVDNCIKLKEIVTTNAKDFIESQVNGTLTLPNEIVVVIADKTYDSWICADYENLKTNELFDASKITEEYTNVDEEIESPCTWLQSKLKQKVDLKSRAYRKKVVKTLRPDVAVQKSRSFRKFHKEVCNLNAA
ncbi:MAG: DUF4276 family protein [Saprospiraceae bacterium]|nr:DUF4276 family protein [Saprospiraceae bacterium]